MITAEAIRAIVSQYEKFGWRLQKVLLRPQLRESLDTELSALFGNVELVESDLDAAWFTRDSKGGRIAWELRALQDSPFALIEVVDIAASDDELSEIRQGVEKQLRERRQSRDNGN